jgi:hypothetical protein
MTTRTADHPNAVGATQHGAGDWVKHPIDEAHRLHEVERKGESGETPFIAMLGVILFLLPLAALMMALAFTAFYLVR